MLYSFEDFFEQRPEFTNLELTLGRINSALETLPPLPARVVHLAGTNGKGSTAFFLAQLLEQEGASTLLFTSPHIQSVTERIKIRNKDIVREDFDRLFRKSLPVIERFNLSYFESVFYMAILAAQEANPDYLILETGLGGTYDATNSAYISRKTPVFTTMGQDHSHILGEGIREIIKEKAAIAGENAPVFIGYNKPFVVEQFQALLPGRDIRPLSLDRLTDAERHYPAPFSYNYLNALRVAEYLLGRALPVSSLRLPPARRERFGRVLLDGAHNPAGLLALLRGFRPEELPGAALVSMTAERNISRFLELLSLSVPEIILTTIPGSERALSVRKLEETGYEVIPEPALALEKTLERTPGTVLVTGSFYLCAALRETLEGESR